MINRCVSLLPPPEKQPIVGQIEALMERILAVKNGENREMNCDTVDLEAEIDE
jgi:hypothetical protein